MATLLSNFAYNLTEGNRKTKCGDCDCFLEYESVKENSIEYKCLSCNKIIKTKLTKNEKRDSRTHSNFLVMISINLQQLKYGKYYRCRLMHAKRVCKDFEIKNLDEYHDL